MGQTMIQLSYSSAWLKRRKRTPHQRFALELESANRTPIAVDVYMRTVGQRMMAADEYLEYKRKRGGGSWKWFNLTGGGE